LPFTTGNTLAAAVIAEQVASLRSNLKGSTVTVVGAGGDVGSGLSRILHARGVRLLFVGRTPRPLENLARELKGAQPLSWPDAAPRSEIVVLAASAAAGSISLDAVPSQAFILDAGHPPNARLDGHARYALAGRVKHALPPKCDLPALLSARYATGESHACLAEGEVLALEERWEPFSSGRGRIVPERAAEILGLAQRHGIRPAPLCFAVR
jgi:predicted amino acid dehydrogenase